MNSDLEGGRPGANLLYRLNDRRSRSFSLGFGLSERSADFTMGAGWLIDRA